MAADEALLLAAGSSEVLNLTGTPYRTLRISRRWPFSGCSRLMVVQASMPVADVKEFIELARASPGKFNYGNSSTGSAGHFAVNMLKLLTGIDVVKVPSSHPSTN